jgi:hypothetical protein
LFSGTLTQFSTSGTPTSIASGVYAQYDNPYLYQDKANTEVAYFTLNATHVRRLGGGGVDMPDVADLLLSTDGSFIVYLDYSGALYRTPTTQYLPQLISSGPYLQLVKMSADNKWLQLDTKKDAITGLVDMDLISTAPSSQPITVTSQPTAAFLYDQFSADNAHALFGLNNVKVPNDWDNGYTGDFGEVPLTPVGMYKMVVPQTVWSAFATSGAKVVYNDNYNSGGTAVQIPTADIKALDLANSGAPKILVSQADKDFFITKDNKKLAYAWSYCADDRAGIWTLATP